MIINNLTRPGKVKIVMMKGERGATGLPGNERVNVVALGISNQGEECSELLQTIVSEHNHLYFPPGIYRFSNIRLGTDADIVFDDAAVECPAADDFIMYAEAENNAIPKNISIKGGTFRREGTELCSASASGIFRFDECENVRITMCTFKDSATMNNVRCRDCTNVEVAFCITEGFHGANFIFLNDCENVYVHDCQICNGTNLGYQYIYPVASGFTDYTNTYKGITNFIVENCVIRNCDWEGIDCHGGVNIRFANNEIIDAKERFITAYADGRPTIAEGTEWGNIVIENNYCENTISAPGCVIDFGNGEKTALLIHGDAPTNRRLRGVTVRNNTLINPFVHRLYGLASCRYVDSLTIADNTMTIDYIPSYTYEDATGTEVTHEYYTALFRLIYNYNAQITGNRIIGHSSYNAVVRVNASTATINGNTFISRPAFNTLGLVEGVTNTAGEGGEEEPVAVRPFYYTHSTNTGNYGVPDRTPFSKLYAPGELIYNTAGLTGRAVKTDEKGLRSLTNASSTLTGTVDDLTTVNITGAVNMFLPGEYVTIDSVGVMITDVTASAFTVDTPLEGSVVGGQCTIELTPHTQRVLFDPASS